MLVLRVLRTGPLHGYAIAQRIRALSDLKLNLLHLHFSDDQGFRIQSETHPEVTSKPALSKDDVRALIAEATRRHMTIVPELDMPGHMTAALAQHPELQLTNAAGQKQPDKLDVTLPAARKFAADLVGEYMGLFPAPWWHMGADEYLGAFSTEADYNQYPQLAAYAQAKYGPNAKQRHNASIQPIRNQLHAEPCNRRFVQEPRLHVASSKEHRHRSACVERLHARFGTEL